MILTFVRKTAQSQVTNCPSLYRTDRDSYVVVGRSVRGSDLDQITGMLPDEAAVEVPTDVLREGAWPMGQSQ